VLLYLVRKAVRPHDVRHQDERLARKVFHVFRHGLKDAARACMPEEHHDAITGHSNGSVGRGYGTGVPLYVLAESMAKVAFKGLQSDRIDRQS
jgi:hypothetical protein